MGHTRFPIVEVSIIVFLQSPLTPTDLPPFADCLLLQVDGLDASPSPSDLDPAQLSPSPDQEQEEDRRGDSREEQPGGPAARHVGDL